MLTGRFGEAAAIAKLLFEIADGRSLGHLADGQHVADAERRLAAAVDELAGEHAFGGDDQLLVRLVFVLIAELDERERRAAAWIVDDVADDAADVAVALGVVDGAQLGGAFAMLVVRLEDRAASLTLRAYATTHCDKCASLTKKAKLI